MKKEKHLATIVVYIVIIVNNNFSGCKKWFNSYCRCRQLLNTSEFEWLKSSQNAHKSNLKVIHWSFHSVQMDVNELKNDSPVTFRQSLRPLIATVLINNITQCSLQWVQKSSLCSSFVHLILKSRSICLVKIQHKHVEITDSRQINEVKATFSLISDWWLCLMLTECCKNRLIWYRR